MTVYNFNDCYHVTKNKKTLTIDDYLDNFVDFNRTLNACKKCRAYNKNWACPDFDCNISSFYEPYEKIDLIYVRLIFDDSITNQRLDNNQLNKFLHETLFKEKNKLTEKLKMLEKNKNGVYLSSGYCNLCRKCSKIRNEKCLFPDLRRNSVESIGGLVVKITREIFGTEVKWIDDNGKVPEYLSILNAVLY